MRKPSEIIINGKTLEFILQEHELWLRDEGGKRADLRGADLKGADLERANLERANLKRADLERANLIWANLERANLKWANLERANLERADLRGANLERADLKGADLIWANLKDADLDFSCMPLWCGDLTAHYDDRQIIQQLYHVLSHVKNSKNASVEIKELLNETNLKWANKFHRVEECGVLESED